jgi:glycine hydroxymethyltransferase
LFRAPFLEAQGSPLTNKYAEGYPGRRYYGGCEFVDIAEKLAIERAESSCSARPTPMFSPIPAARRTRRSSWPLLKPGDKILGLDLAAGGHLTHGAKPNQSGKWFEAHHYGVREETTRLIDYDALREQAKEVKPQLLIAGGLGLSAHD